MALVFHQNMRNYGGHTDRRNDAFKQALTDIGTATGHLYWAAGFTEVLNDSDTLFTELSAIAQTLDPGLTGLVLIEVGLTAVGRRSEYVAIAWDPANFIVDFAGHVLLTQDGWLPVHHSMAGVTQEVIHLPMLDLDLKADTRGLAFVAGRRGHGRFLIGFMHNMYAVGDLYGPFANLPLMASRAREAVAGDRDTYANASIILGGDFNVEPRIPRLNADPYLEPRGARVPWVPLPGGGAAPYANTTATHAIDFWLVNDMNLTDAACALHVESRSADCSDHAGISLTL